jgi:hypothetical protein
MYTRLHIILAPDLDRYVLNGLAPIHPIHEKQVAVKSSRMDVTDNTKELAIESQVGNVLRLLEHLPKHLS